MKTLTVKRNKSFEWSFGLHAGLFLLGFLPLMYQVTKDEPVEYLLELGYEAAPVLVKASGSEGLEAKSPVYHEEPQPNMNEATEQPIPVDDTEPTDETTIAENNADIISDVTEASDTEISASESTASGSDSETHADGAGQGSPNPGNQDGAAHAGDGGGGDGLEGDGIITRKIVHRADITQVAKVNGRVTLNVCIDRQGRVVTVAYNPEKTTITDTDIIKRASHLAAQYRYEANYAAPAKECGQLTFIFSIEEDEVVN